MAKAKHFRRLSAALGIMLVALAAVGCKGSSMSGDVRIVATVAQLKAMDPSKYKNITTLGYHVAGDGGGGSYVFGANDDARDNGGTVLAAKGGGRWKLVSSGTLSLRQFGAKGDDRTDDTESIQNWLNAIRKGQTGYAPAGRYRFSKPLTGPIREAVGIRGDGSQQTVFVYNGEDRDTDLITFGSDDFNLTGWTLSSFGIDSRTNMTGGAALHIKRMVGGTRLNDVSISALNKPKNCWNGVWFDRTNVTTYETFEINVQNEGIMISGTGNDDSASDLVLDKGTITFCRVGIHAGGGFGGLYVGQVLVYGAKKSGFLQDNSLAKRGNREIILSNLCVLDACHEYNVHINDPLSQIATLQMDAYLSGAGWIAPAEPGDGLYIQSLPQGRVSVSASQIRFNSRHGINIADESTRVQISPTTYIVNNKGVGILASDPSNIEANCRFEGNVLGDIKKP